VTKAKTVAVPNVVGKTYTSAASTLKAAGLTARRGVANVGTVTSQVPKAGTKVKTGSTVVLRGSGGKTVDKKP
jgi:beta-lactam-binding protein with PASTA domain